MPDTSSGDYRKLPCSDCKKVGMACFKHWGPLVPPGEVGVFDIECWQARMDDADEGRPVRPLGVMSSST